MRNTMGGNEAAGSRGFLIVSFKWHKRAMILSFPDGLSSFFFFHVLLLKQCVLQRESPYQCFQSIRATKDLTASAFSSGSIY